jgi:hypothetical protein
VPAAGDVISSFTALAFTEPHPHLNHGTHAQQRSPPTSAISCTYITH